jgi:site-specific DNA recombinase
MRKAVIYCRYSDDDKARSGLDLSIASQIRECTNWARKNSIVIEEVFKDEGKSGTTIKRPALQNMLQSLPRLGVGHVICLDVDRLARNSIVYFKCREQLEAYGIKIAFVNQPMIDETAMGGLTESMMAGIAEYYARSIGERTKKALLQKAEAGYYPGGGRNLTPGYDLIINTKAKSNIDRKIVIPNRVARHVQRMYEMYGSGMRLRDCQNYWSKYVKYISSSKTALILENPFYTGKFRWGGKIYYGKHQPIISPELFRRVQKIRQQKPIANTRDRRYNFLLKGLLVCGECQHQLWAERHVRTEGVSYRYYICRYCKPSWSIPCDQLESDVCDLLEGIAPDSSRVREEFGKYLARGHGRVYKRNKELTSSIRRIESALEKITDDYYVSGETDRAYFDTQRQRYIHQIESIQAQINQNFASEKNAQLVEKLVDLAMNIKMVYVKSSTIHRQKILRLFFKKIIVNRKGIVTIETDCPFLQSNIRVTARQSPPLSLLEFVNTHFKEITLAVR